MITLLASVALLAGPVSASQPTGGCAKTFSKAMVHRAVDAEYAGARDVSHADRQHVRRFIRCARQDVDRRELRQYRRTARLAWHQRRLDRLMQPAIASWYYTEGVGACGFGTVQSGYRFASLFLPCGARVRFCHGSACIEGVMSDHGPYVAGRSFDLNYNMKVALGCGGICSIRWRQL